jgi:phosphoribosylanthranilate isomerase
VKQAIQTLRPWGVDVVSGVESAPGKKDPARMLAFIRSAQEAAAELQETVAAAKSTNGEEGRS